MENLIKRNLEEYIRKTFRVKSNGKKKKERKYLDLVNCITVLFGREEKKFLR